MTGTITYILSRAGYRAMNGALADERRRLAGAEPPAAYVSYDPRLLAGAGWYGYRIALKGGDRSMFERARYMLADRYIIREGYEYYADGVYVFGVLLRERVPHYGIGGGAEPGPSPIDEWWGLKLTMPEGGTVILRKNGSPNAVSLEVSTDGQNWQPWTLVGTDYSYTLADGETLCVRNTSTTMVSFSTNLSNYYNFVFDNTVEASGSVMSLSVNDDTALSLADSRHNFCNLFRNCASLVTAPEFPATTISNSCYYYTFRECVNLSKAPELPATTLENSCYYGMFRGCTRLVIAPILPATALAFECYNSMFQGCESLETAPSLPATTLSEYSYTYMFSGCKSLVKAPSLPAATLTNDCYSFMFRNCSSLAEVRTNMTDISASGSLNNWLSGVSPTGDFYCPSELTIPTGASGIPSGWTRHDI